MNNLEILNHICKTLENNFAKCENHEITPFELREMNERFFNSLYAELLPAKMGANKFYTLWDKATDWLARKHGVYTTFGRGR